MVTLGQPTFLRRSAEKYPMQFMIPKLGLEMSPELGLRSEWNTGHENVRLGRGHFILR